MNDFFKKLKELRNEFNYTQQQMADKLGISLTQYQNYEVKTIPPHEKILKLNNILDFDFSRIIYKENVGNNWEIAEDEHPYITKRRNKKNHNKPNLTPVFDIKASAGRAILFNDRPEIIADYVDIPFIGKSDGVIEIVGASMNPTYVNGTRIAVRKLEDKQLIYPNECYYIIDVNYDGRVKRLIKSEKPDHIILRSDNKDYPDVELPWEKIVSVCKILCRIIKS